MCDDDSCKCPRGHTIDLSRWSYNKRNAKKNGARKAGAYCVLCDENYTRDRLGY